MNIRRRKRKPGKVAKLIQEAREKKHWTARDFLEQLRAAGVSAVPSGISAWEHGTQLPRSKKLPIISSLLEIPLEELQNALKEDGVEMGVKISSFATMMREREPAIDKEDLGALLQVIEALGPLSLTTLLQLLQLRLRKRNDS